jgi:hypothetical protein
MFRETPTRRGSEVDTCARKQTERLQTSTASSCPPPGAWVSSLRSQSQTKLICVNQHAKTHAMRPVCCFLSDAVPQSTPSSHLLWGCTDTGEYLGPCPLPELYGPTLLKMRLALHAPCPTAASFRCHGACCSQGARGMGYESART